MCDTLCNIFLKGWTEGKKAGNDTLMRLLLYSVSSTSHTIIDLEGYSSYANHLGQNNTGSQDYQQLRNTTTINCINETINTIMKYID